VGPFWVWTNAVKSGMLEEISFHTSPDLTRAWGLAKFASPKTASKPAKSKCEIFWETDKRALLYYYGTKLEKECRFDARAGIKLWSEMLKKG
jgi:hypothetical protein